MPLARNVFVTVVLILFRLLGCTTSPKGFETGRVDSGGEPVAGSGWVVYELTYVRSPNACEDAGLPVTDTDCTGWWSEPLGVYEVPAQVWCLKEYQSDTDASDGDGAETFADWESGESFSGAELHWYWSDDLTTTEDDGQYYLMLAYNDNPLRCVAYVWEG